MDVNRCIQDRIELLSDFTHERRLEKFERKVQQKVLSHNAAEPAGTHVSFFSTSYCCNDTVLLFLNELCMYSAEVYLVL